MIKPILEPQQTGETRKIYSVSELAFKVRKQLEDAIGQIWITGEISNLALPASGHWYFTLKDNGAQLRCAIFKNRNRSARFTPEDGQQVLLRAKLSLYEPRGDIQLIGEYIEPAGEGALQIAFNRLKEKLQAEGLFAPELKRPIPKFPNKIGIITSPSGAAIRDVLTVLKRRMPQIPVIIYPSQVQGEKAAKSLIKQLEVANQHNQCDVLLVTRGGGSLEDMWCFNDETLARNIRDSRIPVVSAVGHEVDTSISDWVADLRAPTPSAAAELLVPDQAELQHKLVQLERRLTGEFEHRLQVAQSKLDTLIARIIHPKQQLNSYKVELQSLNKSLLGTQKYLLQSKQAEYKELDSRLHSYNPKLQLSQAKNSLKQTNKSLMQSWKYLLKQKQQMLALKAQKLNNISPLATLERGYTITEDETGKAITSMKQAQKSQELTTRFVDGKVKSKIFKN
ncbi:exodeoxyribonuclease VII large subunit [Kangiella koreensis]|uniref:Exodeoxyribonuclease 7 large subunit n=1 Tax=Kangiella koreensis (strain DSM 16069 / JCM 12317 / KCTC 12182 / SW-125) TaxID=523791 RepID=C7R5S0_KANKD|nr:exodeoxyribonuclease VII large subunit [Kangiella koreensis]ACV27244.1 exodeoxyribonuclease VII, large subunit [Kangiella koreensis DSM 16069]